MVTSLPTTVGSSRAQWMTTLSWIEQPPPISM
jgi:hypothetical protein